MNTPVFRLAARAFIVAVMAFLAQLQASDSWDSSLLRSAILAAMLAVLEYLTPLNPSVGKSVKVIASP